MKKTWLPLSLGLLLALFACGGTGASSSSSILSSAEGSSSLGEGGSSSSEISSSSRPDSSSEDSSSSSSTPLGEEKAIDLTGESDEYASRPGAGLKGDFSLMEIIGTDIYYLSASSSRSEEGSILLMEEGAIFENATDLVNISSFRLVYELSAGAEASLAFGDGESAYVSFELPSSGTIDIVVGSDFGPGYSHFRLLLSSGTLALKEVHISFKEEEEPFNVSLSMSLLAERADIGSRLSDLLGGVYLETSEHRSLLLESGYEAVGTLNGKDVALDTVFAEGDEGLLTFHLAYQGLATASQSVYVYDFDNPPSAEAVLPSVESLSLYPGESYSFSYETEPMSYDPSLVETSSSNPEVLKVEGTRVTALRSGTANVLIAAGEKVASIAVEVLSSPYASVAPISYTASDYSANFAPSSGDQKVLIVPIALAGNPTYSWTNEEFAQVEYNIFGEDNEWSLVNYYERASNGRLSVSGEVYGSLESMPTPSPSSTTTRAAAAFTRCWRTAWPGSPSRRTSISTATIATTTGISTPSISSSTAPTTSTAPRASGPTWGRSRWIPAPSRPRPSCPTPSATSAT